MNKFYDVFRFLLSFLCYIDQKVLNFLFFLIFFICFSKLSILYVQFLNKVNMFFLHFILLFYYFSTSGTNNLLINYSGCVPERSLLGFTVHLFFLFHLFVSISVSVKLSWICIYSIRYLFSFCSWLFDSQNNDPFLLNKLFYQKKKFKVLISFLYCFLKPFLEF